MCDKNIINFYYILNNETNTIYIGSTSKCLNKRFQQHKRSYIQYLKNNKSKGYYSIFDIFENCTDHKNININLIQSCECDKIDKLKKEDEIISLYRENKIYNVVNKNKPYDESKFAFRKAYREVYKSGSSCKTIIEIDGRLYKISISPISPI